MFFPLNMCTPPIRSQAILCSGLITLLFASFNLVAQTRVTTLLKEMHGPQPFKNSGYPGYSHWDWNPGNERIDPPTAPFLPPARNFRPQLIIQTAPDALLRTMQQTELQCDPVNDKILDTDIYGSTLNLVRVTPQLISSRRGIEVQLNMTTNARSSVVGIEGDATVGVDGKTLVLATKKVLLTPKSFQTTRARAVADSRTRINDFQWQRHIGHNIAFSRAYRDKSTSEYISASNAAIRAQSDFDKSVDEQVRIAQRQFRTIARQLQHQNQLPDDLRFRSQSDRLIAEAAYRRNALSNNDTPPTLTRAPQGEEVALQMHQSLINDWLDGRFGDEELTEADLVEQLRQVFPSPSTAPKQSNKPKKSRHEWQLKMATKSPVHIQLDGDSVRVTVKIQELLIDKAISPGITITAEYQIQTSGKEVTAIRGERLDIQLMQMQGKKRLGARQTVFRSMLRREFDPVFAETLDLSPIFAQLPSRMGIDLVQDAQFQSVRVNKDWVTIWSTVKLPSTSNGQPNSPANSTSVTQNPFVPR